MWSVFADRTTKNGILYVFLMILWIHHLVGSPINSTTLIGLATGCLIYDVIYAYWVTRKEQR